MMAIKAFLLLVIKLVLVAQTLEINIHTLLVRLQPRVLPLPAIPLPNNQRLVIIQEEFLL
jgi:hypothetical protein